jgi:hypothetical protein
VVEFSPRLVLQLLPMPVLHVVAPQTLHQVEHNSHVCHLLTKSLTALNESDFLID